MRAQGTFHVGLDIMAQPEAAKYEVTLTREDGTDRLQSHPLQTHLEHRQLPPLQRLGTTKTAFFIDNVKLEQR